MSTAQDLNEQLKESESAKLKMKEAIAKRKELARLKKEEEERAAAEQKRLEAEALAEKERELKEKIKKAKEEAVRKKLEEEQAFELQKKTELKLREEAEMSRSEKLRRHKEEIQRQKQELEEKERLEKERAEKERVETEETLKQRIKERKRLVAEQEEQKRREEKEEKERIAAERAKIAEEQKKMIEANREEARRRKEQEERELQEAKRLEEEEKERVRSERTRRRKEELEKQKKEKEEEARLQAEKEKAEQAERERARKEIQAKRQEELQRQKEEAAAAEQAAREAKEKKIREFEEEQREAMRRHMEEARLRKQQEQDQQTEEERILEEQRQKEFEAEQERRRIELERSIAEEEKRIKAMEEKLAKLGDKAKGPVNRCGLFTVFGEEPGLEIWVLGDQQISKIAKMKHGLRGLIGESHGSFHVERAYVILHTSYTGGVHHYRLHSWIGSQCPDEMRKQCEERMAELEEGLSLAELDTITHEKERQESEEFRAYFDKPIEYVESVNLKKSQGPNFLDKALYQIKGRNFLHCRRVDADPEVLNSGDVFVLEDSFGIYQFNGRKSNKMERGKALDYGVQLRIERNARVRVWIYNENDAQCEHEKNKFWAVLRLNRDENGQFIPLADSKSETVGATPTGLELPIKSPEEGGNDEEYELAYIASWKMYKIGPDHQPTEEELANIEDVEVLASPVQLTPRGPTVEMLNEYIAVILDCDTEIFVWYGNLSSMRARRIARQKAKELHDEPSRKKCTVITKVRQKTEPYIFKEKFLGNWGDAYTDFDFTHEHIKGNIALLKQEEVNIDCMYHPEKYAIASEDKRLPIPNKDPKINSELEICLVREHDKTQLEPSEYGHFFSGNCYLMIYVLKLGVDQAGNDLTRHVVYFWQGWHASREDKGLSALLAGNVAKQLRFCQVERVVQNKEPEHFLSHFNSNMIVHFGIRPSDVKFPNYFLQSKRLVDVRGNTQLTAHGVETTAEARNLNSNDSFVLFTAEKIFVWNGLGANEFKQTSASSIASNNANNLPIVTFKESEESEEFWNALGGKSEYASAEKFRSGNISAKFFECTNIIGIFRVYELEEFSQQDLLARNCVILDSGDKIFVWVGSDANQDCEKRSLDTAEKYKNFENEDTPKRPPCEIVLIRAGEEPIEFQAYFHTWDALAASDSKDSYKQKLKILQQLQQQS